MWQHRGLCAAFLCAVLLSTCQQTTQRPQVEKATSIVFFVAKDGNDANPGTAARPFATLERARDEARRMKGREPVTIFVRGGVYNLVQTFRLTNADSGTKDCPVVYRAYPGEKVLLSGCKLVAGWRKHSENIYVADLAAQGFDDFRFRELFFKGERQILARFPNLDPAHPVTGGLLYVDDTAALSKNSFHYKAGSIPFDRWKDISQAEVNIFPYHCWDHNIIRIQKVDTEMCLVKLRHSVAGSIFIGNRYFIQNVFDALDAPGEWFSDYATGKLYFWPPTGGPPADFDVCVPVLENIVEFSGTPEKPVEHITFHGFTLMHARQDAIALEGAHRCTITGNTITQVGGVGINLGYLRNARKGIGLPWRKPGIARINAHSGDRSLVFSHPCTQCRIAGNDIFSIGGDGVVLGGSKNIADNNHIYQTGIYDRVCAGLTIYGDENVASHNNIHDIPRDGIFINGKLNVAEYNDIRNSMLYTADNGAIALRQHDVNQAVINRGNVLRYNRLLDTIGYGSYPHCVHPGDGYASPFCSFGIYLDGSICGVTVYGNIIARCGGPSVFIQFGGGNVVENNIFVEGPNKRIQFDSMIFFGTFMYADKQGKYKEPPNQIKRNIFCYAGPETTLYKVGHWDNAPEWNRQQAVFDENLIWHEGMPIAVCMHKNMDCKSLQEWQAYGYDTRSIVADPLFVDPTKDDYRLKPDSPAYKVGFKNINAEIEKIGVYPSQERASWPLRNAVLEREKPVIFEFSKEPQPIIDGFELSPIGFPPAKAKKSPSGVIEVTDEVARTGNHCLKFVDAPGLQNAWEPHLYYCTKYTSGKFHFSIDVMNSKDAPADFYMEFRDWQKELRVGPTFRVTREGKFFLNGLMGAKGKEIATVPNGEWYNVTIDFELGEKAPKEYTLKLSVTGKPDVVATLPFGHPGFSNANWFGISSTSAERAVFYVDNLIYGPAEAEKVQNAQAAPVIKGIGRKEPKLTSLPHAPDGLVAWWRFEEEGTDLADSSGNGLHGDLGNALWAKGDFGKALYLDGSGAAFFPDSPLLQFGTHDFSIVCWLYPICLDIQSTHKRRRVIEKCAYPTSWWNVDILADGRVQMEMIDENHKNGTTLSAGTLPEKKWTHLVITVDRKNFKTSYYFNGRLDSAKDIALAFTGGLNVPGRVFSTGTWQPYIGMIDDLKIYRRVLKSEEIAADYEKGKAGRMSGEFTIISEE